MVFADVSNVVQAVDVTTIKNKRLCTLIALGLLLLVPYSLLAQASKSSKIIYEGAAQEAIADLRSCLGKYQGPSIQISKVPLDNRSGQAYFLQVAPDKVVINYTTLSSMENAVYTLLDHFGFRWYGPGENWFFQPAVLNLKPIAAAWYEPTFRNRQLFGTGGLDYPSAHPFDPNNDYKKKFTDWKRRNRFNSDFFSQGHQGQAFYLANKNLLDANPQWFNAETGKLNGRIRIEQNAAVTAFKNWVKQKFLQQKGTEFISLGVDPEDGRGGPDDPLPKNMAGVKNHSDKWWWLANEVAKDYDENDKRVVVTAYAYGDGPFNALAPSFPLRKNVYPVIIPYAFQTAYLPEEMVEVWARKVQGNMGIYDYWNITQWSLGVPQFDIYSMVPKMKFWKANKIDGICLETTEAAGPMGHTLWLAGQLQFRLDKNFESLYTQYLTDCFGASATEMRRMFDRWSKNYQGSAEVAMSLADLREASNKVPQNSAAWRRLTELKAYIHYLRLFYAHDGTQASKDRIFTYLYRINHLMMVQTAAFMGQAYITPLDKGHRTPSPNVQPMGLQELEQQFQRDLQELPQTYKLENFSFDIDKVRYTEPIPNLSWLFGGFHCQFFFKAPITGTLSLDAGAQESCPITIFSEKKVLLRDSVGKVNYDYKEDLVNRVWYMKRLQVQIVQGETYYIKTSYGFNRVKINKPQLVLLKRPGGEDFDNYSYPVQYFYVPRSTKEIVFYDAMAEGTNDRGYIISPSGKKLIRRPTNSKNIYSVPVAAEESGKVWKADFGHPTWSFKNIPNITALQPFAYAE